MQQADSGLHWLVKLQWVLNGPCWPIRYALQYLLWQTYTGRTPQGIRGLIKVVYWFGQGGRQNSREAKITQGWRVPRVVRFLMSRTRNSYYLLHGDILHSMRWTKLERTGNEIGDTAKDEVALVNLVAKVSG